MAHNSNDNIGLHFKIFNHLFKLEITRIHCFSLEIAITVVRNCDF